MRKRPTATTGDETSLTLARRAAPLAALVVLAAVGAAACGGTTETRKEFSNQGEICVYPAAEDHGVPGGFETSPRTYAAGEMVNVAVQFPTCLSSSCSKNPVTSCTVSGTGGTLQVTSSGSYVDVSGGACTTDCGFLIARCQTSALAAGTTTLQHGSSTLTLTLPFTGAPPCAGAPGS